MQETNIIQQTKKYKFKDKFIEHYKHCENCNKKYPNDKKYCIQCGTKLKEKSKIHNWVKILFCICIVLTLIIYNSPKNTNIREARKYLCDKYNLKWYKLKVIHYVENQRGDNVVSVFFKFISSDENISFGHGYIIQFEYNNKNVYYIDHFLGIGPITYYGEEIEFDENIEKYLESI